MDPKALLKSLSKNDVFGPFDLLLLAPLTPRYSTRKRNIPIFQYFMIQTRNLIKKNISIKKLIFEPHFGPLKTENAILIQQRICCDRMKNNGLVRFLVHCKTFSLNYNLEKSKEFFINCFQRFPEKYTWFKGFDSNRCCTIPHSFPNFSKLAMTNLP